MVTFEFQFTGIPLRFLTAPGPAMQMRMAFACQAGIPLERVFLRAAYETNSFTWKNFALDDEINTAAPAPPAAAGGGGA